MELSDIIAIGSLFITIILRIIEHLYMKNKVSKLNIRVGGIEHQVKITEEKNVVQSGLNNINDIKGNINIINNNNEVIQTGIYKFKEKQQIDYKEGQYKLIKTDIGYRLEADWLSISNTSSISKIVGIIKDKHKGCLVTFEPQIK